MKTLLSILMILSYSALSSAAPLKEYRSKIGAPNNVATKEAEALERVAAIRKQLGTAGRDFAAVKNKDPLFTKVEEKKGTGRKMTAASFFKTRLAGEAVNMQRMETEQRRPTFFPSKNQRQIKSDREMRRQEFCSSRLGKEFPALVNDIVAYLIERKQSDAPVITAQDRQRIQILQGYIVSRQPQAKEPISRILGDLYSLDFVDGSVTKLRFTPVKNVPSLQDDEKIELTLSMLISYRTDQDDYYVSLLECFLGYVNARLEADDLTAAEKANLELIRPFLGHLKSGAVHANKTLKRLSTEQANFLLDLMLQLRGADVPVAEEMVGDDPAAWNSKANPSVATLIQFLSKKYEKEARYARWREGIIEDEQFYTLLNDQLDQLDNYLQEEVGAKKANSKAIEKAKER